MDRRDFAARRMRVCFSGPPDSRRELDRHTATPATMPRQHVDDTFDSLARATSIGSKLRRCNRQRMAVAGPRRGRSGGQSLARRWRWQGTSQHGARRGRVKALRSVRCRSCSSSRCAVGADGHDRRRQAHIRVTPQAVCTSMAPAEQALDRDGGLERHGRALARDGGLKRSRGEMLPPRTLGTHTAANGEVQIPPTGFELLLASAPALPLLQRQHQHRQGMLKPWLPRAARCSARCSRCGESSGAKSGSVPPVCCAGPGLSGERFRMRKSAVLMRAENLDAHE